MPVNKPSPVRLGLCPLGKFVFSHDDAVVQKRRVQEQLRMQQVDFVDLDSVLPDTDGLLQQMEDVGKAVRYMRAAEVDAVFLPHCNFGTEAIAGLVARDLGLPTLLWGPRDGAPEADGSRLRDSLCGLLASSKVVRKLVGNHYSYIENTPPDHPTFLAGLDQFLRAAAAVRDFRRARIGLLGARIDFFWSCIIDESDLLRRFDIEVQPFEIAPFLSEVLRRRADDRATLERRLAELEADWLDIGDCDRDEMLLGIAAADELLRLAQQHHLSAFAVQNFFSVADVLGSGGAIYTMLAAEQLPIADESDIHGAISSILMRAAKRDPRPVFFPEFVVRHPEDDNQVCLWHVGAPASVRHAASPRVTIKPPWILPGTKPIQSQMRLADGPLTICRFDGEGGQYRIGVGEGVLGDGPKTRDFYGWLTVNDWPRWERQLIEGPYIHHVSAAYGSDAAVLQEAAKYLDIGVEVFGS